MDRQEVGTDGYDDHGKGEGEELDDDITEKHGTKLDEFLGECLGRDVERGTRGNVRHEPWNSW